MHRVSLGPAWGSVYYVTVQGAMRLIAFARVRQGAAYTAGKDYHVMHAALIARDNATRAKRKAERAKEAEAEAVRAGLLAAARVDGRDGE